MEPSSSVETAPDPGHSSTDPFLAGPLAPPGRGALSWILCHGVCDIATGPLAHRSRIQGSKRLESGTSIGGLDGDLLKCPHREGAQAVVSEPTPELRNGGGAVGRDGIAKLDSHTRVSRASGLQQLVKVIRLPHDPISIRANEVVERQHPSRTQTRSIAARATSARSSRQPASNLPRCRLGVIDHADARLQVADHVREIRWKPLDEGNVVVIVGQREATRSSSGWQAISPHSSRSQPHRHSSAARCRGRRPPARSTSSRPSSRLTAHWPPPRRGSASGRARRSDTWQTFALDRASRPSSCSL